MNALDDAQLLQSVAVKGSGVVPDESPASNVSLGAPPYMDDLVLLVANCCPAQLIEDTAAVAGILDRIAADFGFVVQYGGRED